MATLPKPKKIMPQRPRKRPDEDLSGPLYIKRMIQNGPRKGERLVTWLRRLAGIQEARRFWIDLWRRFEGDRQAIQKAIGGLSNGATTNELALAGLDHQTCFFMAFTDRPNDLSLDVRNEVMKFVKGVPSE